MDERVDGQIGKQMDEREPRKDLLKETERQTSDFAGPDVSPYAEPDGELVLRLSARASGKDASQLSEAEIEAAEAEAEAWARRVNSC